MPKRIQRKRTKGWRMPENAVYVGRPTVFGNPVTIADVGSAAKAIEAYRAIIDHEEILKLIRSNLRGKDLACWCPLDQPCHADVLLEIANAPEKP
jgi:hypothetical protein